MRLVEGISIRSRSSLCVRSDVSACLQLLLQRCYVPHKCQFVPDFDFQSLLQENHLLTKRLQEVYIIFISFLICCLWFILLSLTRFLILLDR